MSDLDFDMQAAWLRRFSADAQDNLGAFALRLKEALPELVTIQESKRAFLPNPAKSLASPSSLARTATSWKSFPAACRPASPWWCAASR